MNHTHRRTRDAVVPGRPDRRITRHVRRGFTRVLNSRLVLSRPLVLLVPLALGWHAAPALAVDGVIEINQAKAMAGGVTTGDTAGFPVSITEPGSYRLTGDLTSSVNQSAINISSDHVTLDMNGFSVVSGGGSLVDGVGVSGTKNVEIRNGTIRGFTRSGIFANNSTQLLRVIGVRSIGNTFSGFELQGSGHLVDGCMALSNGTTGIRVTDGSLVINSVARGNTTFGLLVSPTAGYRSNVLTGNNGGDANAQVAGGGLQLGSNVCGTDLVCP